MGLPRQLRLRSRWPPRRYISVGDPGECWYSEQEKEKEESKQDGSETQRPFFRPFRSLWRWMIAAYRETYVKMAQKLLDQCEAIRKLVGRADDEQNESVLGGRLSGHRLIIGYQLGQVGDGRKVARQEGQFGYDQGTAAVTATRQVHAAIHH